jgi:hypothetical protein
MIYQVQVMVGSLSPLHFWHEFPGTGPHHEYLVNRALQLLREHNIWAVAGQHLAISISQVLEC